MKIESELVTKENENKAIEIQNIIFPNEKMSKCFEISIDALSKISRGSIEYKQMIKYFLVKDEQGKYIGMWGIYTEKNNRDDAWLGWFGILPEYRRLGNGTAVFKIFETYAKENGFKYIRLYTDEMYNENACKLYEKMGMTKEKYNCLEDKIGVSEKIVIYSKKLTQDNTPFKFWNNQNLHLNFWESWYIKNTK